MAKKTITQNNLPNFWNRIQAFINDRLPKGALAAKDTADIQDGGTGATSAKDARVNLGITYGTEVPTETPETGSGAIYFFEDDYTPVSVVEGGTGAKTAEGALENLGIGDWIVEQGISERWTYRKWNSGIIECWGKATLTTPASGAAPATITLPITFYDNEYYIQYSKSSSGTTYVQYQEYVHPETYGRTTTQFVLRTYNATSAAAVTQEFHMYVIGRWK